MDAKQHPEPIFAEDHDALGGALALSKDGRVSDDLSISLRVAGGLGGQRYRFGFLTRGERIEVCSLDCELSDRHAELERAHVDEDAVPALVQALVQRVARSDVLRVPSEPSRFLPDTLIGTLEITSGGRTHRVDFAADPDQASVQGKTPPDAVLEAVDAIYTSAGTLLGVDQVGP